MGETTAVCSLWFIAQKDMLLKNSESREVGIRASWF
jgi:hypothetical protein